VLVDDVDDQRSEQEAHTHPDPPATREMSHFGGLDFALLRGVLGFVCVMSLSGS